MRIELDEAPADVTDRNCSIYRRDAAQWAYFNPDRMRVLGALAPTFART